MSDLWSKRSFLESVLTVTRKVVVRDGKMELALFTLRGALARSELVAAGEPKRSRFLFMRWQSVFPIRASKLTRQTLVSCRKWSMEKGSFTCPASDSDTLEDGKVPVLVGMNMLENHDILKRSDLWEYEETRSPSVS